MIPAFFLLPKFPWRCSRESPQRSKAPNSFSGRFPTHLFHNGMEFPEFSSFRDSPAPSPSCPNFPFSFAAVHGNCENSKWELELFQAIESKTSRDFPSLPSLLSFPSKNSFSLYCFWEEKWIPTLCPIPDPHLGIWDGSQFCAEFSSGIPAGNLPFPQKSWNQSIPNSFPWDSFPSWDAPGIPGGMNPSTPQNPTNSSGNGVTDPKIWDSAWLG